MVYRDHTTLAEQHASRRRPLARNVQVVHHLDAAGVVFPGPCIMRGALPRVGVWCPARRVLGVLGPHTPSAATLWTPPSWILAPSAWDSILRERKHLEVPRRRDVKTAKPLVVGDAQGRKRLVKMDVAEVDRHVEVGAKQVPHRRGGQQPVVGQHACIVPNGLWRW